MKNAAKGLVVIGVAILLGACASTFKATHDHDPNHDFSNYRTFAWISDNPMQVGTVTRVPNPLMQGRIMSTIETALAAKGYRKVSREQSPDFVLAFTVGSREEIRIDSYPSAYGGGSYRWGGGYYGYGTETRARQYTKGMLAIDVFDVAERRPVWHGVAEKTISDADREDAENTISAAVDAILADFPPQ